MKHAILFLCIAFSFTACKKEQTISSYKPNQWETRSIQIPGNLDLTYGKSYLPVYSHIYKRHEQRTFELTITASIRNVSLRDTLYILNADYYNTKGEKVRSYIASPIFVAPLETVEIVVDEKDSSGGSGAKFIFNWAVKNPKNPPLFEGVMSSTLEQQGISYTTRGIQIWD